MLSSIKSREDPQIVMLYISPQSLARPELQQCLDGLISRQVLSVVGIDEMQHVVMDGRFFRREFQLTKKLLLDPLVPPVVNDCCDPFPYPNPPPNPPPNPDQTSPRYSPPHPATPGELASGHHLHTDIFVQRSKILQGRGHPIVPPEKHTPASVKGAAKVDLI